MLELTINEKGGPTRTDNFNKNEITIGRVQGNDIVLPKGNISKKHSRIVLKDGKFIVVDLKSTNGTYVNGKKITGPQVIKPADKIYIGDFTIQLAEANGSAAESSGDLAGANGNGGIDMFAEGSAEPPRGASSSASPSLLDESLDREFEEGKPASHQSEEPEAPPLSLGIDEDEEPAGRPALSMPKPAYNASPGLSRSPVGPTHIQSHEPAPSIRPSPSAPVSIGGIVAAGEPLEKAEAIRLVHLLVADVLGLRSLSLGEVESKRAAAEEVALEEFERLRSVGKLAGTDSLEEMARAVAVRATDMSLILELVEDDGIVEFSITPDRQIWVAERDRQLEPTDKSASNEAQVTALIAGLGVLGGSNPGADEPLVDVRLRSGARVVASLPPLAFRGPSLSYRKASRDDFSLERLLEYSAISPNMLTLLEYCVRFRQGVLLCTGPGVNAAATLNALAIHMPPEERIVSVEQDVELHLGSLRNVVSLRPQEGLPADVLVRHAVVSQADRVVLGALPRAGIRNVLTAFAQPLGGSIAATAAVSPQGAVREIEGALVEDGLSLQGARSHLAFAFPIILQEHRFHDNSRRITSVCELSLVEGELHIEELFHFRPDGLDEHGIVKGEFAALGQPPRFLEELVESGEAPDIDLDVFRA
jgi:pilus assembly protein CpaF